MTGADPATVLAALQARGAQRFDPVRFHFLEALVRRTLLHEGATRCVLEARLGILLREFGEAFAAARSGAASLVKATEARFPESGEALAELLQAGDFGGLRALAACLQSQARPSGLADLVLRLAGPGLDEGGHSALVPVDAPGELKSVAYFRRTWSRLSVDQTLNHSQALAPENAGPLNSQHLVLRALKLMRDISPGYLSHFMSHMDALLWLEQATSDGSPVKNVSGREADKKPKPRRRKST